METIRAAARVIKHKYIIFRGKEEFEGKMAGEQCAINRGALIKSKGISV
jgi:hypothetical protein